MRTVPVFLLFVSFPPISRRVRYVNAEAEDCNNTDFDDQEAYDTDLEGIIKGNDETASECTFSDAFDNFDDNSTDASLHKHVWPTNRPAKFNLRQSPDRGFYFGSFE